MPSILHTDDVSWEQKRFRGSEKTYGEFKPLWKVHGSSQMEMRLTRIPGGGETNTRYHTHTREEEWFYVLSGSCHICLDGKWRPLVPGDSVWKEPGSYHIFRNFGDEPCEMIMVGPNIKGSRVEVQDEPDPPAT